VDFQFISRGAAYINSGPYVAPVLNPPHKSVHQPCSYYKL